MSEPSERQPSLVVSRLLALALVVAVAASSAVLIAM
jgi:hypothetical protein